MKQEEKGNGEKNIVRVKCYNYGKKCHYAQDCAEPLKIPFYAHLLNYMFVPMH